MNGIASFPALSLNHSGTGYTLVATSAPLTPVPPAPASHGERRSRGSAGYHDPAFCHRTERCGAIRYAAGDSAAGRAVGSPVSQANVSVTVVASGGTPWAAPPARSDQRERCLRRSAPLSPTGTAAATTRSTFQASWAHTRPPPTASPPASAGSATTITKSAGMLRVRAGGERPADRSRRCWSPT